MIETRIFTWAGHVARLEEGRSAFKTYRKAILRSLGVDGRTVLERNLIK